MISVVIPSFNQARFLADAIRSLIDEQYPRLELLVVDGGSTDGSVSLLYQYQEHFAWWVSEPDNGQANAINKGFARSTGEIMGWLNSDDMIAPGTLWHIGDYFRNNPAVDVVYGDRILIDESQQEIGRWILPAHCPEVFKWFDPVPQESLYWRRRAWDRAGSRLDESLNFAIDWDLLRRFLMSKLTIVHLPAFLGLFRVHGQQKTQVDFSLVGVQEMNWLRKIMLGFEPDSTQVRRSITGYLLRARLLELGWKLKELIRFS